MLAGRPALPDTGHRIVPASVHPVYGLCLSSSLNSLGYGSARPDERKGRFATRAGERVRRDMSPREKQLLRRLPLESRSVQCGAALNISTPSDLAGTY